MALSPPKTLASLHHHFLVRAVAAILAHPKLVILVPAIIVFVLGYNVIYDFTVIQINAWLAAQFSEFLDLTLRGIIQKAHSPQFGALMQNLKGIGRPGSDWVLSKIALKSKHFQGLNVLDTLALTAAHALQECVQNTLSSPIIVSPLTTWPLDLSKFPTEPTHTESAALEHFVLQHINHHLDSHMTALFLDDSYKFNHIIKFAQTLKIYVFHRPSEDMASVFSGCLAAPASLTVDSVASTANNISISDFASYFVTQNGYSWRVTVFCQLMNFVEVALMVVFLAYIFLCISNLRKVRSSLGLLVGWSLAGTMAGAASMNIVSYIHNYKSWKLIFEPLTVFTRCALVLSLLILSSRNLFRVINDIAGDNTFAAGQNIHKRLFRFYVGINTSVSNPSAKLRVLESAFALIGVDLKNLRVPNITKVLAINISGMLLLSYVGELIFQLFFDGPFLAYISKRLFRFTETLVVGLIIDHILQLTFLVGIIVVDLHRIELSDILDGKVENYTEEDPDLTGLQDINIVSSVLLGAKGLNKPKRGSLRYNLGLFFLKLRPSGLLHFWIIQFPVVQLLHLLGVFINWLIVIPYKLLNDEHKIVSFGTRNIVVNRNDCIYYVELFTILVLIVCSAELLFRFAYAGLDNSDKLKLSSSSSGKFSESDFEVTEELKLFKLIDVAASSGHDLDVLKIKTNIRTSFVVSVGLDHKILVWLPLNKPGIPRPINLSSSITVDGKKHEFWPINHANISDDCSHVVLVNFKYGWIKCFERKELRFCWERALPEHLFGKGKKPKILESFFRQRTVPGFLARKILQQKKLLKRGTGSRRNSEALPLQASNSNFPPPRIPGTDSNDAAIAELEKSLIKQEFVMVLETGDLITLACEDGTLTSLNVLDSIYDEDDDRTIHEKSIRKLDSAKKLSTTRVSDRIICHVNNFEIIVATVISNNWKLRKLPLQDNLYNKGRQLLTPMALSTDVYANNNNFRAQYDHELQELARQQLAKQAHESVDTAYEPINKSTLVTVPFVGMIVRVRDLVAELIDVQSGVILRKFNIGHFKPVLLRVSHSEPSHCKFCGCASVELFSFIYEDFYDDTVIVHTFKLDAKRSKSSICLRVERDPNEIRCLGFNAVVEHQYWYEDMEKWEVTGDNVIIGLQKQGRKRDDLDDEIETISSKNTGSFNALVEDGGLSSLRSRKARDVIQSTCSKGPKHQEMREGCLVQVIDGHVTKYAFKKDDALSLSCHRISVIERYGYKAVIVGFGTSMRIVYQGNDKLIENDVSMGAQSAGEADPASASSGSAPANDNEMLFLNKRRRAKDRRPVPEQLPE